jgi:hypothetical protein
LDVHHQTLLQQLNQFYVKRDAALALLEFPYTMNGLKDEEFSEKLKEFFETMNADISSLKSKIARSPLRPPTTSIMKDMTELKSSIANSNWMNFALFQDLSSKFEGVATKWGTTSAIQSVERTRAMQRNSHFILMAMLETFDQLDFIYQGIANSAPETFVVILRSSIEEVLQHLVIMGIEEIPVLGKWIDGEIMESIGTVSLVESGPSYKPYQVYAVHQRGFRYVHSQKLIRKAKIISVL